MTRAASSILDIPSPVPGHLSASWLAVAERMLILRPFCKMCMGNVISRQVLRPGNLQSPPESLVHKETLEVQPEFKIVYLCRTRQAKFQKIQVSSESRLRQWPLEINL